MSEVNVNWEAKFNEQWEERGRVQDKNLELRSALSDLKDIVYRSTVSLLWIFRLGLLVGIWFFPMPQDRWYQAVGALGLLIVSHLLSKAVVYLDKIKTH